MGNPYPANFETPEGGGRLTGQVDFTDPANQPGGSVTPPVDLVGTDPATIPLEVDGSAAQTADVFQVWAQSGDAAPALNVHANGNVEIQATRGSNVLDVIDQNGGDVLSVTEGGFVTINPSDGGAPALTVENFNNAQTQPILEVDGIDGSSFVNARGSLATNVHAAPADAAIATGQLVFWFDQTNGAAKLMVKAKQADGTVKTAAIALA